MCTALSGYDTWRLQLQVPLDVGLDVTVKVGRGIMLLRLTGGLHGRISRSLTLFLLVQMTTFKNSVASFPLDRSSVCRPTQSTCLFQEQIGRMAAQKAQQHDGTEPQNAFLWPATVYYEMFHQ